MSLKEKAVELSEINFTDNWREKYVKLSDAEKEIQTLVELLDEVERDIGSAIGRTEWGFSPTQLLVEVRNKILKQKNHEPKR